MEATFRFQIVESSGIIWMRIVLPSKILAKKKWPSLQKSNCWRQRCRWVENLCYRELSLMLAILSSQLKRLFRIFLSIDASWFSNLMNSRLKKAPSGHLLGIIGVISHLWRWRCKDSVSSDCFSFFIYCVLLPYLLKYVFLWCLWNWKFIAFNM